MLPTSNMSDVANIRHVSCKLDIHEIYDSVFQIQTKNSNWIKDLDFSSVVSLVKVVNSDVLIDNVTRLEIFVKVE